MNPKRQYQEKQEKHDNKCLKILNGRVEMGLVMAKKKAIEFKGNFILNPLEFFSFRSLPFSFFRRTVMISEIGRAHV